jgi:hypothetical protein
MSAERLRKRKEAGLAAGLHANVKWRGGGGGQFTFDFAFGAVMARVWPAVDLLAT